MTVLIIEHKVQQLLLKHNLNAAKCIPGKQLLATDPG